MYIDIGKHGREWQIYQQDIQVEYHFFFKCDIKRGKIQEYFREYACLGSRVYSILKLWVTQLRYRRFKLGYWNDLPTCVDHEIDTIMLIQFLNKIIPY